MSGATLYLFSLYAYSFPTSRGIDVGTSVFAASTRPRLKKRYHNCVERVKEYLETIKCQSLLSMFEGTLRSLRRVSLLNFHFW